MMDWVEVGLRKEDNRGNLVVGLSNWVNGSSFS